jgi:hypothetical protein
MGLGLAERFLISLNYHGSNLGNVNINVNMNVNNKLNSSNAYAILKLAQKEASAGGIHFRPSGWPLAVQRDCAKRPVIAVRNMSIPAPFEAELQDQIPLDC